MLTEMASHAGWPETARRIRTALARIKHGLDRVPAAVGKLRSATPPPIEPVSLDRVLESRHRARRHAQRAEIALNRMARESWPAPALADVHMLIEEIRQGLSSENILNDVAAMLVEGSESPELAERVRALEARLSRLGAQADELFTHALDAQEDLSAGAKPMEQASASTQPPAELNHTAKAVRDLGEMLADVFASSTPSPTPPSRRYAAVADQMAASFQAYGLPYDGVQLPHLDEPDKVRSQLIESLQRNFASREQDGTRVYFQTSPQPAPRDTGLDARLLRGGSLVNANLLRAEADSVMTIIERLPDMLRFTPLQTKAVADTRGRLSGFFDQIVATASDPLGLNAERGKYQFKRLSAAIVEILTTGEIVPSGENLSAAFEDGFAGFWEVDVLQQKVADQLHARTTVVRAEEVKAEIAELGQLMSDIHRRVTTTLTTEARGVAAALLEELLTAADAAADQLNTDLVRFGTTAMEQDVQFPFGPPGKRTISLAQFISWVRAVCLPFTGTENAAADLLPEEARILTEELQDLSQFAGSVAKQSSPLGYSGVRRQFEELKRLLEGAAAQARALNGGPQ